MNVLASIGPVRVPGVSPAKSRQRVPAERRAARLQGRYLDERARMISQPRPSIWCVLTKCRQRLPLKDVQLVCREIRTNVLASIALPEHLVFLANLPAAASRRKTCSSFTGEIRMNVLASIGSSRTPGAQLKVNSP